MVAKVHSTLIGFSLRDGCTIYYGVAYDEETGKVVGRGSGSSTSIRIRAEQLECYAIQWDTGIEETESGICKGREMLR